MYETRSASLLFLTAGLGLLLAYLFIAHFSHSLYGLGVRSEWSAALSSFFSPGYANAPGRWLRAELIKLGMATSGLACLALAAVPRGAWRTSIGTMFSLRIYWRQWIWAVLLASSGIGLAFTLVDLVAPLGLGRREALLQLVGYWAGVIRVLCGLIICARLLFARERRPFERWLGYVFAALALYGMAWALLRVLGLDLDAMLRQRSEAPSLAQRAWSESFGIAFDVASAWTGLFIARRRSFVATALPSAATAAYLCSASLLLYLGLRQIFSIGRIFDSVGPLALTYAAAAFTFLGITLLASLHAARMTAGAASVRAPEPDPRRYGRLLVETPVGLVVSGALMAGGYFFVSQINILALAFLMPLAMLLLFVGPIVVFIYGILRRRFGYAIGAALLALGLFGYRSYNLHQVSEQAKAAVAEAETLNIYPFKPPRQAHDTVVVVDGDVGAMNHAGCFEHCRLVLLTSSYTFAVEDRKGQSWSVLHLMRDRDTCRKAENRASMFDLLAAGQADACVLESKVAPHANALIIRENRSSDAPIKRDFPKGFRGNAFELLERTNGRDELLGRIVWGGVQPPLLSDQKGERASYALDEKGFYAAALALPGPTLPPVTAKQAKAAVAVYLDLWTEPVEGGFHNSWVGFLAAAKEPAATEIVKETILDLLLSENPARTRFALYSLFSFRAGDPDFVKQALALLVTSDRLHPLTEKPSNLTSLLKEVRGAFPEPQRQAARAAVQSPDKKHDDELLALLSVLGHGGAAERSETAALILALPQEEFQWVVASMGDHEKNMIIIEPPLINFWSLAQISELARRASDVPDALLANYIQAMRWTPDFTKVRAELKNLLQKRLAAGVADERERSRLQLIESQL